MTDCHRIIREGDDDRAIVRIVIGALTDKSILGKPEAGKNYTAMGIHAAMFGYLAKTFKHNMIDPIMRPASRKRTYERIINFIKDVLFQQGHEVVANGCALGMIDIMEYVFDELFETQEGHLRI